MTVAFKQKVTATATAAISVTTAAMASATTVGNVCVACMSTRDATLHSDSMADNKSNTWVTQQTVVQTTANRPRASIITSTLTTAGTGHTFTGGTSGSATDFEVSVAEFSGVTSTKDSSGTGTAGNSTTTVSATAATATFTDNLLISVICDDGTLAAAGISTPASVDGSTTGVVSLLVNQNSTSFPAAEHSYKILSGAASHTASYTYTTDAGGLYSMVVAQLKGLTPASAGQNQFLYYQPKQMFPI